MVFKRLTINYFGKIEHLDISFREQITEIAAPDTDDIVKAVGLVTYNKSIIDRTGESSVSYNTKIVLQLDIAGHPYSITVRGQPYGKECIYEGSDCKSNMAVDVSMLFGGVKLCEEEESLTYYRYDQKNDFSTRLLHYMDPEKYYSFGDFQRKTNGFGFTKAFRIYLKEYFKKHGACGSFTDLCKTEPCPDGWFIQCRVNVPGNITDPHELEQKLYDFGWYLEVNKFWDGFENIRDMNHEKWPMLIDAGDMGEYIGFHELLVKSKSMGKQTIIMNSQKAAKA